jgi:hypothetical protein
MKRILVFSFITLVLVFGLVALASAAESTGQKATANSGVYNSAVIYPGEHPADALLFKNPRSVYWQRLPKMNRISQVTCSEALAQLNSEGKWQGRLKRDGSCGNPAEPQDWILGNRLNYEESLQD